MALFLASALLLFLLKDVTCQSLPPYTTRFANRNDGSNSLTLRCIGQFGAGVPGAIFYRNSQQITNSSCLMAYPTGSSSELRITLASQECDGYFSCGVNGTLSEPVALYACPVKNNSLTGRTELVEEGTNVLLTCDFYPSPINRYRTTWIRSPGSTRDVLNNRTMDLQSYTVNNPQQMTTYACRIYPEHDCFNNAAPPWGPTITIYLKERYIMPMITKDLNYTRQNGGSGGVFSVSTSGTNLTHKWYKNDKLINGTGAGILAFGNDALTVEDSNGLLRITYEASNVDYDNMTQTTQQTFGLYTNMTATCDQPSSVSTALAVSLGIFLFLSVSLAVACIILSILLCQSFHKTNKKPTENKDDRQTSDYNRNPNSNQNTGGTTPNSTPDGTTNSIHLYEQPDRALHYHCDEIPSCKNNYEFLHCLAGILTAAKGHKKFKKECSSLFSDLRHQIEKHMEKIEPQEGDGISVVSDVQSRNAYKQCEEMVKILKDLASDE